MSAPNPNIPWSPSKLTDAERETRLGKGVVVWFTGLSGSGKSTLAREVELALVKKGRNAFVLDGDNIRHGLNQNLDFSPESRGENIRRIGEVAKLFGQANVICLTAFISPYRGDRERVRALLPAGRFIEVYCSAPLAVCESRDVKGLYKKARAGEIADFTGISAPYEPPENPELKVFTDGTETLDFSAQKVVTYLQEKGFIAP